MILSTKVFAQKTTIKKQQLWQTSNKLLASEIHNQGFSAEYETAKLKVGFLMKTFSERISNIMKILSPQSKERNPERKQKRHTENSEYNMFLSFT